MEKQPKIKKKFKITLYPTTNKFTTIVEAYDIQEAIEIAEEIARNNCGFTANENDVEVIE